MFLVLLALGGPSRAAEPPSAGLQLWLDASDGAALLRNTAHESPDGATSRAAAMTPSTRSPVPVPASLPTAWPGATCCGSTESRMAWRSRGDPREARAAHGVCRVPAFPGGSRLDAGRPSARSAPADHRCLSAFRPAEPGPLGAERGAERRVRGDGAGFVQVAAGVSGLERPPAGSLLPAQRHGERWASSV